MLSSRYVRWPVVLVVETGFMRLVAYVTFVSTYLFLISSSFGVSGWLCFVIVAFSRYLHLYLNGSQSSSWFRYHSNILAQTAYATILFVVSFLLEKQWSWNSVIYVSTQWRSSQHVQILWLVAIRWALSLEYKTLFSCCTCSTSLVL